MSAHKSVRSLVVCLAELPALLLGDHNRFALVLADPPALFERIPCSSKSRMSACHVSPERWEHWIGRCIRQDCSMQTRPAEPEGPLEQSSAKEFTARPYLRSALVDRHQPGNVGGPGASSASPIRC